MRKLESGTANSKEKKIDTVPPNLSLNLVPDHRAWELPAAAILGISLELLVLVIAGLTKFHPQWKGRFAVELFDFYCMLGGTVLLTFGLIICALSVEQRTVITASKLAVEPRTVKTASKSENGDKVCILWLQRGRSNLDESYKPYILGVERKIIRASRLHGEPQTDFWKALTLTGTMAAMLGYIVQFIGLGQLHWPTQATQFAVTLIMTGVRAFIRRAPHTPPLRGAAPIPRLQEAALSPPVQEAPPKHLLHEILDEHEMDWLATMFVQSLCKDKNGSQEIADEDKNISKEIANEDIWQMMALDRELQEPLLSKEEEKSPCPADQKLDKKVFGLDRLRFRGVKNWELCANGLGRPVNGRFLLRLQSTRLCVFWPYPKRT
jgi:hypothetical protein